MKNAFLPSTSLLTLALTVALTLSGCDKNGSEAVEPEMLTSVGAKVSSDDPNDQAFDRESDRVLGAMMRDMEEMMMTGDPDMDFVRRLIEHHKGAIAMATLQFKYGNDKAPTDEAGIIITEQAGAIKKLATFANKHGIPNTSEPK